MDGQIRQRELLRSVVWILNDVSSSVPLVLQCSRPLFSPPIFPLCPFCSPSLSMWALACMCVCVCLCVSSSLMFWACQCNGASLVSRACCSWIASYKASADRQVKFECTCIKCRYFVSVLAVICTCMCKKGCSLHSMCVQRSAQVTVSGRVRGLLPYCRGIYNPERTCFNNAWIHGTSNIAVFSWRRREAELQDDTEGDGESALPLTVCRAFYLLANRQQVIYTHHLFIWIAHPSVYLLIQLLTSSSVRSPLLSHFASRWL